jgi:superfamily II DNA or RNA helicase
VVRARTRTWLVEEVEPRRDGGGYTVVHLACVDDDAQGQTLNVIWEHELDARILNEEAWSSIGERGFDDARPFSAFLHTLRWNCVTATDPSLFQAPFRAGIRIDAYQLEPLRKALRLPRVNLFIADDVGLGKTIEAGLIATELLLRRRVREIVVAAPPSMLLQWKEELESRFGLVFEILDRAYIERVRRERGYSVNPWETFPRFLISHKLLIDETYSGPLRNWLDNLRAGSLLILDEAHHAAPASGSRYAIDSRFTRAIRDLAARFEHRLFLSATPHNGHSNSFSALLELLDPQRFLRGVKVLKSNLDAVMVRRLKDDLRDVLGEGFAVRKVVQVDIRGLPADAPELHLSRCLDEYRETRLLRLAGASKREQAEAMLVVSHLQQRLLSSIEAFARTLAVHRRTMERVWEKSASAAKPTAITQLDEFDADDDRSALAEDEQQQLHERAVEAATAASVGDAARADIARERALLDELAGIADAARGQPDARMRHLIGWIREHMCPGGKWNDLRVLIFTEYDDSRRYLVNQLRDALASTDHIEARIEVFHGPTPVEKREEIKRAFNEPPDRHPLRILVATDAAREGINLQAQCWNLFHFDVPWNPSRLEQRNGRIDRKLQPSPEVFCHYFVYEQRPEDAVLKALVRKTDTIRKELGSLAQVLEHRLSDTLRHGISHKAAAQIRASIEGEALEENQRAVAEEELEATRERHDALRKQVETLRNRINDARAWIGLDHDQLRDALSCSLEMLRAEPLTSVAAPAGEPARFSFPRLESTHIGGASWTPTLDTLRAPPREGPRDFQWRREAPIRPVIFDPPRGVDDTVVQLHLSHRIVQRLLGRFLAQGFVHHDLSRACFAQTRDAVPRVILLGRLALYGAGAVRLHEEILAVSAAWQPADARKNPLKPYARAADTKTRELLEDALRPGNARPLSEKIQAQLLASVQADIRDLLPHLHTRGGEARTDAEKLLTERGRIEADELTRILEQQRRRVLEEMGRADAFQLELKLDDERRQHESNRRYWQQWLENIAGDLDREPARIRAFYAASTFRIEPVGIAYLWPVTG